MAECRVVTVVASVSQTIYEAGGTVSPNSFDVTADAQKVIVRPTASYEGPYEAVPAQSEQVFQTAGLNMDEDFVVKPIPNNYGLITWNGSILTVS